MDFTQVADLKDISNSFGTYYNSVSDQKLPLPVGATRTGNDPFPQREDTLIDKAIGSVESTASGIVKSTKETFSDIGSGISSGIGSIQTNAFKWILIFGGLALVSIYVIGKSGILKDAGEIAKAANQGG